MDKYAIEVDDLVIKYRFLKSYSIKKNLLTLKRNEMESYQALNGISFKVKQGEIIGVVGKNGSGKSTLLKAVAGIFSPDSGKIDLHNNSVSLLSIGVGFQKKLSGRENIYLSGLLLGFSEKEISERINEIIEFSELGDFIDRPVSTYSSGMFSKLSFSITAIMKTDIILVDEILSVGDSRFKKKSFEKMKELIIDENRTVMIVSHNSNTISELCDRTLWIDNGNLVMFDTTDKVIKKYENFMNQ